MDPAGDKIWALEDKVKEVDKTKTKSKKQTNKQKNKEQN